MVGDTHGSEIDPRAEAIVLKIIADEQPERIIHLGDAVDCYSLSSYDRDPQRKYTIQDDVDAARKHLYSLAKAARSAKLYLLEGNHEDRLRRTIWRLPGASAQLAQLRIVRESLTWPKLLGLDEIGFTFVPSQGQSRFSILPGLVTKHGDSVRPASAESAKAEWLKYAHSGISGHTHRLGAFYHRDRNGSHAWFENGCLCGFEKIEYMQDPDWQQGFTIFRHTKDGRRWSAEQVYIQDGKALHGGKIYTA